MAASAEEDRRLRGRAGADLVEQRAGRRQVPGRLRFPAAGAQAVAGDDVGLCPAETVTRLGEDAQRLVGQVGGW